jgi:hypothetical protein
MACFAAPPLFPPQITFTENQRNLYALDVQNQRAFSRLTLRQDWVIYSWLQKKFPYAKPGSPEAENYVELSYYETQGKMSCQYSVHWQYTTNPLNNFPTHWTKRTGKGVETKIGTYIAESDVIDMVQGEDVKIGDVELNYWKATNLCNTDDEGQIPCHQRYFRKGTESPFEWPKPNSKAGDLYVYLHSIQTLLLLRQKNHISLTMYQRIGKIFAKMSILV